MKTFNQQHAVKIFLRKDPKTQGLNNKKKIPGNKKPYKANMHSEVTMSM